MSKRGQVYSATMKLTEEVAGRNVLNCGKKLKKNCQKICQLISQNFCHFFPAKTWWIECAKKLLFFTQNRQKNSRQKMFFCQFRSFLFCRTKYFFFRQKKSHTFSLGSGQMPALFSGKRCRIKSQLFTAWKKRLKV